jgi:hypothetical protein
VTIKNTGEVPLTFQAWNNLGAPYTMGATTCGSTLAVNQSCTREIVFTPIAGNVFGWGFNTTLIYKSAWNQTIQKLILVDGERA